MYFAIIYPLDDNLIKFWLQGIPEFNSYFISSTIASSIYLLLITYYGFGHSLNMLLLFQNLSMFYLIFQLIKQIEQDL